MRASSTTQIKRVHAAADTTKQVMVGELDHVLRSHVDSGGLLGRHAACLFGGERRKPAKHLTTFHERKHSAFYLPYG